MSLMELAQLNKDSGLASGYMRGRESGTNLAQTAANTAQTQAQTQRYTGETPSFLRKSQADARHSELANVQGEADMSAGVPTAKAGQSLIESKQKAQEAQAQFDAWPAAHKVKLMDQTSQKLEKFNQLGLQLLQFSGSTGEAIQQMTQAYPEITEDPQFASWSQKYGNMPREQALNAFKFEMQKYASGIATTREKFQTEALQEDQKQQGRMEVGKLQGEYGLAGDQLRAAATASGAGGKENTTMAIRRLAGIIADPNTTEEQKAAAEYELQAQLKFGQQSESSGIDPMFDVNKSKTLPPRPGSGGKTDIKSMVEAGGKKYDPAKFDYRINPETGKVQSKPKGK